MDEFDRLLDNHNMVEIMLHLLDRSGALVPHQCTMLQHVTSVRTCFYAYFGTEEKWKYLSLAQMYELYLMCYQSLHTMCMEWRDLHPVDGWISLDSPHDHPGLQSESFPQRNERLRNEISMFRSASEVNFRRFYHGLAQRIPKTMYQNPQFM